MRPAGPEPATSCKSMLAARARWRTAGEARALVPAARETGAAAGAAGAGVGETGAFFSTGAGASLTGAVFSATGSAASEAVSYTHLTLPTILPV